MATWGDFVFCLQKVNGQCDSKNMYYALFFQKDFTGMIEIKFHHKKTDANHHIFECETSKVKNCCF